jgi:isoquinoline 1-oxidoreductase beta subunit
MSGNICRCATYQRIRQAGASARSMLVAAAADIWKVKASEITVSKGVVSHKAAGMSATFGELAEKASSMPLPHPTVFGIVVKSFDASETLKVQGVTAVKQIPTGVAVYGKNTYAAIKGRTALKVQWDHSDAEKRSIKQMMSDFKEALQESGLPVISRGDFLSVSKPAKQLVELEYSFPYLAHAPMEPLDAVIQFKAGKVNAWMGSQIQTLDQNVLAASFGRRAQPTSNLAAEAASIVGWEQTVATQSIMAGSPFEGLIQNGIDPTSVEGTNDMPYKIPAPIEGRLNLLKDHPRETAVLKAVEKLANKTMLKKGSARGVTVHKSFSTYVVQIAEVEKGNDGMPKIIKYGAQLIVV